MKKTAILIFVLSASWGISQSKVDSLIVSLTKEVSFKKNVEASHKIAWTFIYSNPDSALLYLSNGLKSSIDNKHDSLIGKTYNLIGIVYDVKSDFPKSLDYYDSAYNYAIKAKDTNTVAGIFNNKGLIYWNTDRYEEAIEEYLKSSSIFEKNGNKKGWASCLNNIGLLQTDLKDEAKGFEYHNKALKIRRELNDLGGINDSKLNIASLTIQEGLGDYDTAFKYLQDNKQYFAEKQNKYALGKVYGITASYFRDFNERDSAIYYSKKSVQCYNEINATNFEASSLFNLSGYLDSANNKKEAKKILLKAEKLADKKGSLKLQQKIKLRIGEYLFDEGNFKGAALKYIESRRLKDSLYTIEQQKAISNIELKYQSEKKENEINKQKAVILNQENEIILKDLNTYEKQKWIYILIVILLLLVVGAYLFFKRKQRKAEMNILIEKEKGLNSVILSQENERRRIAKEIHDSTLQQLVSLKFSLNNLATTNKNELIDLLDNSTNELRDLSYKLMPKNLEKFGLEKSIDNLLSLSLKHTNIKYEYDFYGINNRLPEKIEIQLYRVIQELIHNTIKHSKADKIDVQLYQLGETLHLIIEDNGVGFDVDNSENGIGLKSIISRVESINGDITYKSSIGNGTTVRIKVNTL